MHPSCSATSGQKEHELCTNRDAGVDALCGHAEEFMRLMHACACNLITKIMHAQCTLHVFAITW